MQPYAAPLPRAVILIAGIQWGKLEVVFRSEGEQWIPSYRTMLSTVCCLTVCTLLQKLTFYCNWCFLNVNGFICLSVLFIYCVLQIRATFCMSCYAFPFICEFEIFERFHHRRVKVQGFVVSVMLPHQSFLIQDKQWIRSISASRHARLLTGQKCDSHSWRWKLLKVRPLKAFTVTFFPKCWIAATIPLIKGLFLPCLRTHYFLFILSVSVFVCVVDSRSRSALQRRAGPISRFRGWSHEKT